MRPTSPGRRLDASGSSSSCWSSIRSAPRWGSARFAAGAGWIVVRGSGDIRSLRLSGAVALTLAAAAIVHTGLDISGKSHLGVFWAKGTEQMGTLFERWNTYSRVQGDGAWRDRSVRLGFRPHAGDQNRPEPPRYRRGCGHGHHPVRWRYRQARPT